MKKYIIPILCALVPLAAALTLAACKDDGVEISQEFRSKTPKNVKLLEYGETSLTICWDFVRGATSYTVQLVDGEMNPVSEALCMTTSEIDYHEFTDLTTDRAYYGRVRANYPYSATSDWVYVTANDEPALLLASVGVLEVDPVLTLHAATSSTLTFAWSYTGEAAADAARRYDIGLFRDQACTELCVSWIADGKLSSGKGVFTALAGYPVVRFTFSGLEPATTYYARVTNLSLGGISTPVVAGTTAQAGPATAAGKPAQPGDVVLAEDFAGFIHGGDIVNSAAGYNAVSGTDFRKKWEIAQGVNPQADGDRPLCNWATEFHIHTGGTSAEYIESLGMKGWGSSGNISTRPGYVKCGGGGGGIGILYTPPLETLPQNSTVTVSFSASAYAENEKIYGSDIVVCAVEGAEFGANNVVSKKGATIASKTVDISRSVGEFGTYSVTLEGLSPTSRIAFSSNPAQAETNKTRFLVDDIVVTCDGESLLEKLAPPANVKFDAGAVYSDKLTLAWDEVPGAASYTVAWWPEGAREQDATLAEGITTISYLLKELTAATEYHARVRACRYNNPDYDSDFSAVATQRTGNAPVEAGIVVSKVLATSSTLTVEWARADGEPCVNSASQVYRVQLYGDAACERLLVAWDASNVFGITAGKKFRFTFSGLAPATTYHVRVEDVTNDLFSEPLSAATAAAGPVAIAAPGGAGAGEIVLAEDFSRVIHGGDIANFAAGYYPPSSNRTSYRAASGANPDGFSVTRCTANEFDVFSGGGVQAAYTQGTGLSEWGKSGNVAGRPGYLKLGAGGAAASLYTPELTALPDAATVKVKFSAQAYSEKFDGTGADGGKIVVKAVRGAVLGAKGAISGTLTEVAAAEPVDISAAKAAFRDFEVTLPGVTPDCRIVLSTTLKRALLDNIVITCTAVTPGVKPDAPGGVLFDAATASDCLTLRWNAVAGAGSYTLAWWKGAADAPESDHIIRTGIPASTTFFELTGLESATTYRARVKAVGGGDSDWSETTSATTAEAGPESLLPTADLLDVVFRNDGSAADISASRTPVGAVDGSAMMTYYNDLYGLYAAHFNHTPGTSVNAGFYKADYSADAHFQQALADGHTLEALFKVDEKSDGSAEWKMFSSMSSGGTGFLISKASKGTELTFLPNVSTTGRSHWIWTKSGINPEAGRYYHVVGVWNKQEAKSHIYVDGELRGTMDAPGAYVPPTSAASYWFGIGVDASASVGQNAWKGDVAIARVYDAPLTAEKVKALYETVRRDQQPAAISISQLLFLPDCEAGAAWRYTLYGEGFESGDRVRFEPLAGGDPFVCDGTPSAGAITLPLPAAFASGRYRMVLLRGENRYPLGLTQLTYSATPARVAAPRIIAHRGVHKEGAAENSVAALAKAQAMGLYGSELDVRITADGRPVVNHDRSVPGSSLVIEEVAYERIADLTLSNGEKLPTFDDFLSQAAKNAATKLIVEIKRHSAAENNLRAADAVVEAVRAKGLTERVEYISFDLETCKRIAAALPGAMVQYVGGDLPPADVYADGIRGIDYKFPVYAAHPEWIAQAHAKGMAVNVWTVNTVQDAMSCIARGMDFITTDEPATLSEIVGRTFLAPN